MPLTSSLLSRRAAASRLSCSFTPPPGICQALAYTPPLFGSFRPISILPSALTITAEATVRATTRRLFGFTTSPAGTFGFASLTLDIIIYGYMTEEEISLPCADKLTFETVEAARATATVSEHRYGGKLK